MLAGKTVLTTGGASALGRALGPVNLAWYPPKVPRLDSRAEVELSGRARRLGDLRAWRSVAGAVRGAERPGRAADGADGACHAVAAKSGPVAQQTLFEGAQAILNGLLNRTGADRQGSARDEPLTPTPWEGLQP